MRPYRRLQPSRTFTLAALGLALLALAGLALAGATVACLHVVELREHLPRVLEVWLVWVGSVAGLAGAGAGSMALRDSASRGLTTSQAQARPGALEAPDPPATP